MDLQYTFEKMADGNYQVRLCGEFVCYSNHTDEKGIDEALNDMGYESRVDFLNDRLAIIRSENNTKE